jgi:hypothetical protein
VEKPPVMSSKKSSGKEINGSVFGSFSLFSKCFSNISRLVAPLPIPDYSSTFIGKTNVGAPTCETISHKGMQQKKKQALSWASKLIRAVLNESIYEYKNK